MGPMTGLSSKQNPAPNSWISDGNDKDPGSYFFKQWNPKYDNLLLAGREGRGTDVFDVDQQK